MKDALHFVQGAVSDKDLVPVLTHFHIKDGAVQGTNGRLTLSAPLDAIGDVIVPAIPMLKALDACKQPTVSLTEKSLMIKDGRFSARLPRSTDVFPVAAPPEGEQHAVNGIIDALRKLRPFICDDATRLWACGVLFRGGAAYATNNAVLATTEAPVFERDVILPTAVIDELLRIKDEPDRMVVGESVIGFYWGERWLKASVLKDEWPPVEDMLPDTDLDEIPEQIAEEVERISPFCEDKFFPVIEFNEHGIRTQEGNIAAEISGYAFPEAKYHAKMLSLVLKHARYADFSAPPTPWAGDGLRGLIAQVR